MSPTGPERCVYQGRNGHLPMTSSSKYAALTIRSNASNSKYRPSRRLRDDQIVKKSLGQVQQERDDLAEEVAPADHSRKSKSSYSAPMEIASLENAQVGWPMNDRRTTGNGYDAIQILGEKRLEVSVRL